MEAEERRGAGSVPAAHDPTRKIAPGMLTTDLALRLDPVYEKIARRFYENPQEFADAFAKAWFKLTHRDMGPITRYLGPEVPKEPQIWQDPVPPVTHELIDAKDIASLKEKILASGLSVSQLVSTAWASASSAAPTSAAAPTAPGPSCAAEGLGRQQPARAGKGAEGPGRIQKTFNDDANAGSNKQVSLADLIVLGGCAASRAAKDAG